MVKTSVTRPRHDCPMKPIVSRSAASLGQERAPGLHDLPPALRHVSPRMALLDLTADRVGQCLLRQLPVDSLVGTPRPEQLRNPCGLQSIFRFFSSRPNNRRPISSRPECRGTPDLDPGPAVQGGLQDHERSAGEGHPGLPAGLCARPRAAPPTALRVEH